MNAADTMADPDYQLAAAQEAQHLDQEERMNELATRNGNMSLAETTSLADTFVKSGFFSDTKQAAQAVVKIIAGRELGFGPMASMTGVYVVKGKVSLSANLLGAAIKRSGRYNYRVTHLDDESCSITFTEHGEPCGESTFTLADAEAAKLLSNPTWRQYPRNMLFARALSNGARWYCPDVFGGPLYTPEELGAAVDGETGEVIDAQPVDVTPPDPPAKPEPALPAGDPRIREMVRAAIDEAPDDAERAGELFDAIQAAVEGLKGKHRENSKPYLALARVGLLGANMDADALRWARGYLTKLAGDDDWPEASKALDMVDAAIEAVAA